MEGDRMATRSRWRRELARLAVACSLLGSLSIAATAGQAYAIPSAPAQTFSFYVPIETQSDFFNLGETYGTAVDAGTFPTPSIVVFDFGEAYNNGTYYGMCLLGYSTCDVAHRTFVSLNDATADLEQFGKGFYMKADSSDVTFLSLGTSNYGTWFSTSTDAYDHGETLGQDVDNANTWLTDNHYASEVHIRGGTDTEPSWSVYSHAGAWSNGYDNTGNSWYWDYGSADGCPTSGSGGGSCNNGWTQGDVYNVASADTWAEPLPQIYDDTLAEQWGNIAANYTGSGAMSFLGPMDQNQACDDTSSSCTGLDNTSNEAWDDLYNALNPGDVQTPPHVTNVRWKFQLTV
jgi:hypothetical protein